MLTTNTIFQLHARLHPVIYISTSSVPLDQRVASLCTAGSNVHDRDRCKCILTFLFGPQNAAVADQEE